MSGDAKPILDVALSLPPEERAEIAERLILSLDDQYCEEIEERCDAELRRRASETEHGDVQLPRATAGASTMPAHKSIGFAVTQAVSALLSGYNDFWLLAALSDRGFEEGERNRNFAESICSFSNAGAPPEICRMLRAGINGLLSELLRGSLPDYSVSSQPSGGRDILLHGKKGGPGAAVDVKHVYDMTFPKYYADVAADQEKLLRHRQSYPDDALFQIVFFVQIPNGDYPAGCWYGNKSCKPRTHYLVARTISSQYQRVANQLGAAANWPDHPPRVHSLEWPPTAIPARVVSNWFSQVFSPSQGLYDFAPSQYLRDASVGVAIWEY